jgi:hypothetical protein
MFEASGVLYALWIVGLVVAVLVLPVLVALLHRLWRAARHIERYAAEALTAGVGIAGNTEHISALNQTVETAKGILETAGAVDQHTAAIEQLLASRAARSGGTS